VIAVAVICPLLWQAASASAQDPIPDPSANRAPSNATNQACYSAPTSQTCASDALADLNAARESERLVPIVLPRDWGSLTIPQQLLVLSNLERVDRGLPQVLGLTTPLDADAQTGANTENDPSPTNFYGDDFTSNWQGGYVSPFLSDFSWMYDDGLNSGNLDCTSADRSGCWGHRHDILWDFSEPLVMGAAYAPSTPDGASETELFVGGDTEAGPGQPDAPIAPTWTTISSTLPIGLSATAVSPAAGGRSARLEVWASGEAMGVAAAITSGASVWTVSPAACQLNAGHSCELTITASSSTPEPGTLTLTGPNGSQTVALQSAKPVAPKLTAELNHATISRGHSAKLTGTVSPAAPGRFVELEQRHGHRWSNEARAELRLSNRFSFSIRGRSKGRFSYRVTIAAATGFRSSVSRTVTLTVS
jgi:hypothetical protein